MARIQLAEAQAVAEGSKLTLSSLDVSLLAHVERMTLGALNRAYDPVTVQSLWVDPATTPELVRTLIALRYVSFFYDRQYSEDDGRNPWARRLDQIADDLEEALRTGDIDLPEVSGVVGVARSPSFYPTDASTAETGPTAEDPSAGPMKFTIGMSL